MSGIPSWARRAIRRVRPHRPQGRCGRSAHRAQHGRSCSSRPATGLTTPHLVQGTASCRRRHRAQTPPDGERVNGFPVRPHLVQAGSGRSAPRARSSPDQPADHRRRPDLQCTGVGRQRFGEEPGDRRVPGRGVHRRRQHRRRQYRDGDRDRGDDPRPPARRAAPPAAARRATSVRCGRHGQLPSPPGSTRARLGRGGGSVSFGSVRVARPRLLR